MTTADRPGTAGTESHHGDLATLDDLVIDLTRDDGEIVLSPAEPDDLVVEPGGDAPNSPFWRSRVFLAAAGGAGALVLVLAIVLLTRDSSGGQRVVARDDPAVTPSTAVDAVTTIPDDEFVVPTTPVVDDPQQSVTPPSGTVLPPALDLSRAHDYSGMQVSVTPSHLTLTAGSSATFEWVFTNTATWTVDLGVSVCKETVSLAQGAFAPVFGSAECLRYPVEPDGSYAHLLGPGETLSGSTVVYAAEGNVPEGDPLAPGEYIWTMQGYPDAVKMGVTVVDAADSTVLEWSAVPSSVTVAGGEVAEFTITVHNPTTWAVEYAFGSGPCFVAPLAPAPGSSVVLPADDDPSTGACGGPVESIAPGASRDYTIEVRATNGGAANDDPLPAGEYVTTVMGIELAVTVTA